MAGSTLPDAASPGVSDSPLPDGASPDASASISATPPATDADASRADANADDAGREGSTATGVVALASGLSSPFGVALNANDVYWTSRENAGAVMRMPKDGGMPTTLVGAQQSPGPIMVNATDVYWGSGVILARKPLVGGPVTYVDFNGATALTQDAVNVYWVTNVTDGVRQTPKSGGSVVVLAAGLTAPLGKIAVDRTAVYWTGGPQNGTVSSMPIGGGPITILATGQNVPYGIALDASRVYWATVGDGVVGTVMSVPVAGGPVKTLATVASGVGEGFILDGTVLFWTNYTTGTVQKMSASGGPVTTVATAQNKPAGIAVDETFVYWANFGGGEIMRAPK